MKRNGIEINKIRDGLFEIPRTGNMLVPGRVYLSDEMLNGMPDGENSLKQVINVAHLPGIINYSIAMPDIHWGYGFTIGGVAATDYETGVISPGGVGYDINCGVRIATTNIRYEEIKNNISKIISELFKTIPTGVGGESKIKKISKSDLKEILETGSNWALKNGFADENDLENTEEKGCMKRADFNTVSYRAIERGLNQVGTLGSGNHFLEISVVDEIFNKTTADVFGIEKGNITLMIHTGSRGLGYQICEDYLKTLLKVYTKYDYNLPDKQLVCVPCKSDEGEAYFAAMSCAANYGWNNRQVIMNEARETINRVLGRERKETGIKLLYDVSHNIAKVENYLVNNEIKKLCVHRKGATRAFGPGSEILQKSFMETGQPVLIPGDMGRCSYICSGTKKAEEETFGSSCHGAGRSMSRTKALGNSKGRNIIGELLAKGIYLEAKAKKTIAEEMPDAYKNVSNVVNIINSEGIINKVAKLRPVGVIKG